MFNPHSDIDIIRIRVRPEVKKRARAAFAARGLVTSEAIRIFLCKAIIKWAWKLEPRWLGTSSPYYSVN
ncbi:MAG: type II toxin-antitoxin system RelB/DinJ family antitoxin [Synergistes sp.]|nr:type II toxin-antitoxin system RelB/DinJ family antitoxin [Synergistes sp.]